VQMPKEVTKPIEHTSPVWAASFRSDGKSIVSGSEDSTVQLWRLSGSDAAVNLSDHFVLRIASGAIWWLKFHDSPVGTDLGIASEDKTVRVLHIDKLGSLFSHSSELGSEASKQSGLVVGAGPNGEPQIISMKPDDFVAK
jgi:WD40 repeat protein